MTEKIFNINYLLIQLKTAPASQKIIINYIKQMIHYLYTCAQQYGFKILNGVFFSVLTDKIKLISFTDN